MKHPENRPRDAGARCKVSVVIKALNDEKDICAAIESSLAAVSEVGGEVVVADSHSSDRTLELASRYPIRIVQLVNPEERCPGVAPQLGYQHSCGDYIYPLDADARLIPGFLGKALTFLALHPEAAGVGGQVLELSDRGRDDEQDPQAGARPHTVDRLAGGGLYRRLAIEETGYFSNRNLHGYEDFDLAVRLRAIGWKLWRIPVRAAARPRAQPAPARSLLRDWREGYARALGELLRAAAGERRMRLVWRGLRELRLCLAVLAWWGLLLSVWLWPLSAPARGACALALAGTPWCLMSWRERSAPRAAYSLASWCLRAAGLLHGLARPQRPPRRFIDSRIHHEPPQAFEPHREHYA